MTRVVALFLAPLALWGCSLGLTPSNPIATLGPEASIDCGPITDHASCLQALEVASIAQLNARPIAAATIRRPVPKDDCATAFHPCGANSVIVVIQSGDTLQDVPLTFANGTWLLLDSIR